jgi:hypothetical protein
VILITFSVFSLALYLVLITAKAEKPVSHKYEEAIGIKVLIALLATIGHCFFIAIQNSDKDDANLDFVTVSRDESII